ncbi:hypothetical protein CK203_086935 [Vitis vinifera]|uniref:Uncharacterized protein n=1 Tax=Vitis vinifera TaxID=29760 RepID=A0A438FIW6_VITVI|nr:hypothetical protein CK203_086935 [Vitis vinifera]
MGNCWEAIRNGWEAFKVKTLFRVDAWVVDVWEDGSWNPRFFRQLNDWELEEADNFFGRLHDHSLSLDSENILVWRDTKNDVFSVKSFYSSLANRGAEPFPHVGDEFFGERVALELGRLFVGRKRKKAWKNALIGMDLSLYKNRRVAGEYNISESGSTDDISLDDDYFEVEDSEMSDIPVDWGIPDTSSLVHPIYFAKCLTKVITAWVNYLTSFTSCFLS